MSEPGSAEGESEMEDTAAGHPPDPESDTNGADPDVGDASPDLAARITAALALADKQQRLKQALTLIRAAPELAADAERRGVSARDRAEALLCEGDILYRMGRFAEALHVSAHALQLTPSDAHAWYNIATIFSGIGDEKRALRIVERGLARATPPKNLGLLVCKGDALIRLRRYDEALTLFMSLHQRLPSSPAVWVNTAAVLLRLGRAPEAVEPARRAVSLPLWPGKRAWTILGEALRRTGDLAGAKAAYDEQLKLSPGDRVAQAGLARLYAVELWRERRWLRAARARLYARSLLFLGWAERLRIWADVEPEIATIVKEEHLDWLWAND